MIDYMEILKQVANMSKEELRAELIDRMGEDSLKRFEEDMERWNNFKVIKGGKS